MSNVTFATKNILQTGSSTQSIRTNIQIMIAVKIGVMTSESTGP